MSPCCSRRRTDRDHLRPYTSGGETRSTNLARLCRSHHRAKTHATWTYHQPRPGVFEWTSPAGATYTVDRSAEP